MRVACRVGAGGGKTELVAEVQGRHLVTLKQFILLHDPVESSLHHSEAAVLLLVSCESRQSTGNGHQSRWSSIWKETRQKSSPWDAVKRPSPNLQQGRQRANPNFAAISSRSRNANSPPPPWVENAMCHVHVTAIRLAQGAVTYARVGLDVDKVDGLYAEHLREDSVA
jgi:hypothetical protein